MSPKRKRNRHGKNPVSHSELPPESPAQRYAAAKQHAISQSLNRFCGLFDFPLDDFQLDAARALDAGNDILVTAPTSAGKTIVGLYGVYLALETGKRVFYTTPIKALSNQKFLQLCELFGSEQVGLLTGDTSINGDAPAVVMTTEVLRNMIYAGAQLSDLGFVVMDEVHYLSDPFRGPVWEEIIIHLHAGVRLISLSATVSNASDFASWLRTLRGFTQVVATKERPVPLQHFMIMPNGEIMPLFAKGSPQSHLNRELLARAAQSVMPRRGRMPRRSFPDRPAIARSLETQGLLPAIVFIFSRLGCEDAARQIINAGVRLTTPEEAEEIRIEVETTLAHIEPGDLSAIDLLNWEETLAAGVASHHAGLLPLQKQLVESLFAKGLIRLVFATETLALGINMPARTVVLESLNKFNGHERVNLTPGEYTQLAGRAGRRGIDSTGYAMTVLQPRNQPQLLSGLATQHSYPLHSAFAPTYNMAVNLLARTSLDGAKATVEKSFAQFEALGSSGKLWRQLNKFEETAAKQTQAAQCHQGDIFELLDRLRHLSRAEKQASQRRHRPDNTPARREADRREIETARQGVKAHPCYSCPDRDIHLGHARSAVKAREAAQGVRRRIELRTKSLSLQLHHICELLRDLDYLDEEFRLLPNGVTLRSIYNERDLLVVEAQRRGLFQDLSVAEMAGLIAVFVCENRGGGLSRLIPANCSPALARAIEEAARLNFDLATLQQSYELDAYEPLETGPSQAIVQWAKGSSLNECLELSELSGGDFVRTVRQVIDLADQLAKATVEGPLHRSFRQVLTKLKRGVVVWDF